MPEILFLVLKLVDGGLNSKSVFFFTSSTNMYAKIGHFPDMILSFEIQHHKLIRCWYCWAKQKKMKRIKFVFDNIKGK